MVMRLFQSNCERQYPCNLVSLFLGNKPQLKMKPYTQKMTTASEEKQEAHFYLVSPPISISSLIILMCFYLQNLAVTCTVILQPFVQTGVMSMRIQILTPHVWQSQKRQQLTSLTGTGKGSQSSLLFQGCG